MMGRLVVGLPSLIGLEADPEASPALPLLKWMILNCFFGFRSKRAEC